MARATMVLPAALLFLGLLTTPTALQAQLGPAPPSYRQVGPTPMGTFQASGGLFFESYTFGDPEVVDIESLSLVTLPLAARFGVANGWALEVTSAWARASLTRDDGITAEISGPTDTELRLSTRAAGDLLTLTAVAVLPTGHASLTEDEADVAAMVAADVLPFHISNWGTGGGVGFSTALSGELGSGVGAGLSVTWLYDREFEPFDEAFAYRPGQQIEVRGVLDRTFGTSAKATLQGGFLHFGADQGDGRNVFQSGTRFQGVGSVAFAVGPRSSGIVYAGAQHRQEGSYTGESRVIPLQDLVFAGGGMRLPLGRTVLQPTLDLRNVTGDEASGTGTILTAGLAVEIPAGSATWIPSLRGRVGEVGLRNGRESGVSGFDVGLNVRFGGVAR